MKRALSALVATTMILGAVPISASASTPLGNLIDFGNGEYQRAAGANDAIYIDGLIPYNDNCLHGGIQDFLYPATDVYIVPAGSASGGAELSDVNGTPNTIVATSTGVFVGEMIAVTTPTGSLGAGNYDVVYDNCQDGTVDPEDAVWPDAISVTIPAGDLPPVSNAIKQIKDAARVQYESWMQNQRALKALFLIQKMKSYLSCLVAPSLTCGAELALKLFGVRNLIEAAQSRVKEQVLALVLNRAKNYAAIWQDPVDPDFDQLPLVVPEQVDALPAGGDPVQDALAALAEPLADEGALADALLHALERYQGAQAAGDAEWALVQARAVAQLSDDLATQLRTSTAVTDLRDAVAANVDTLVADSAEGAAAINRIRTTGLTPDERRGLLNRGYSDDDIKQFESGYVAEGQALSQGADQILYPFEQLVAAHAGMADALDESAAGWAALAAGLESHVDAALPVVDAGGPYTAGVDGVVTPVASATTPDGTTITAIDWDTDSDGEFDDASGSDPSLTLDRSRTLGVRVTNDAGRKAVDFAVVTVATEAMPAVTATPSARALTLGVGATQQLTVDVPGASDYEWTVDGESAGDDATFAFAATAETVGAHIVSVVVTRGHRQISETWAVSVVPEDADGDGWTLVADCDDTRADVHRGTFERPGNDRDDDCDPGTPDAPPGGLTGEVWSWGWSGGTGQAGGNLASPHRLDALGDQVTAVESWNAGGYAVMADSTVRSWGYNYNGELGNGTVNSHAFTPVIVQNVGGGGVLSGVVEIAGDYGTALARRQDGSVVGWGYNYAGQVGDGTTVQSRLVPTVVLDADTGGPLTGVASVDVGNNTTYALMNDGTVKDWGYSRCNGQTTFTQKLRAATNPLFGHHVVQLETGYYGGAVALLADGTVLTCGGATPILGRPATTYQQANTPLPVTGLGAGSGVIDVTWGMDAVAVLKDDGTVWMWGANMNNELTAAGVPLGSYAYTPVQVPLPPGPPVVDLEMDYSVTVHAIRADGSVVVWGGNVYNGAGNGNDDYNIVGVQPIVLPGETIAVANSVWNGIALVRPHDPGSELARPQYWISASVADAEIGESIGGSVEFSLSQAAATDVVVDYDFDNESNSVTVPAGESSVLVPLAVVDDAVDEDDVELPISITGVSDGVRTARETGLVTVLDDDAPPALSIADVAVTEGDTSLTDVALTVSLSAPTSRDVVVDVTTVPGTAQPGSDMYAYDVSLLIPAGESAGTVHVSVAGDRVLEDDEAFAVVLSGPQFATLADDSATVTIVDDEPIVMTVTSPAVVEGDVGITPAEFVVTATQPPTATDVVVQWSVQLGTAEADSDVVLADGELTVAGSEPGVITIGVVADELDEPLTVETFRLALGNVAATSGRPVIVRDLPVATITDDDDPVVPVPIPVVVDAGPDVSGTEGSTLALNGSVTGDGSSGAPVQWTVANPACTIAEPSGLATGVSCPDETTTTVTLTVSLADGSTVSDSAAVAVANVNPTLTVVAPVDGEQFAIGATISPNVELGDPGSGDLLECSIAWGDGTPVTSCDQPHAFEEAGTRTITITVVDGDGGSAQATVQIEVLPPEQRGLEFDGFYAPVVNVPAINVVEAGSTVPLKFSLGGDHGLAIFAQGYPASAWRPCNGGPTGPLEPTTVPGGATLTYDSWSGRYHYNWKTSDAWAGQCRTLVVRFVDGTQVTAEFRFKPKPVEHGRSASGVD